MPNYTISETKLVSVPSNYVDFVVPAEITIIGLNSFVNCRPTLKTVTFAGTSVTTIEEGAFSGCVELIYIQTENLVNLETIERYAFLRIKAPSFVFPKKCKIGFNNFGSSKIQNFGIVTDHMYYTSVDGVIFENSMTTLVIYPYGNLSESYTIPSSVNIILGCAFYTASYLKYVYIPSSVTSISQWAFSGSGITSISIPSSVTVIGSYIFHDCTSLRHSHIDCPLSSLSINMFYGCSKLRRISMVGCPAIPEETFTGCGSLYEIYACSETKLSIQSQISFIPTASPILCTKTFLCAYMFNKTFTILICIIYQL